MTYGSTSRNFDRLTRSAPRETQAQWSRRTGPLLPLEQPRKGWLGRIFG
jgi:hypothetical protein